MSLSGDTVFVCFAAVVILRHRLLFIFYFLFSLFISLFHSHSTNYNSILYWGPYPGYSRRNSEFHPGFNLAESKTESDNSKRCFDFLRDSTRFHEIPRNSTRFHLISPPKLARNALEVLADNLHIFV